MERIISALFCFLLTAAAVAQPLAGSVTDTGTGLPIPGARVEVLESGAAVVTDARGAFLTAWPTAARATLVVSSTGFRVRRIELTAVPSAPIEIKLEPVVSFSDRIEVTATRAAEGRDPVTFTNLPQERVAEEYWSQDPAILISELVPGMYAYNDNGNGIGYSYFAIRGSSQARSRVTLNGAPLNDAESGELFFIDLADFLSTSGDIQLQRGVFGLSGIGGAVDITTRTPSLEPSFELRGGLGSYATERFSAVFDSGLINGTWALTARYSKVTTDGYRDQSWVDMWNYYFSLARFGRTSTWRLNLFGGPEQTHLAYDGILRSALDGGLTGSRERDRRANPLTYPGEIDNFDQPHFQLVHSLALSPQTDLAQTFYAFQGDGYYDQYKSDRTLLEYNLPNVVLPDGTVVTNSDLVRRRNVDEWDAGWVPTLTRVEGPWTLTLRGELRLHRAHHTGEVKWAEFYPAGVEPDNRYYDYQVEKRSGALGAGLAWRSSDRLTLTAGLQLANHTYEMSRDRIKNVAFTESFNFVLPRAGLVFAVDRDADIYVQLARGMREPAFRTIYDPQDYWGIRARLDPEDVWDLEAGMSLRRQAWRLRANLFAMKFANEIVWAGALDDSGVPIYGNGARSLHRGVELDGSFQPTSHLGVDATVAYSRNTFTHYREFDWEGQTITYDDNRIAGYPDLLASLTGRADLGKARVMLTVRHVGRFYLDNTEDNRRTPGARQEPGYVHRVNPAFTTVDLAVHASLPQSVTDALGVHRLELEGRLNNLLDELYTAFGYVDGEPYFIPAADRNAYIGFALGL